MKTDRITKLLLAAIAIGLWTHVAAELFHPRSAAAQGSTFTERLLDDIDSQTVDLLKLVSSINDHADSDARHIKNIDDAVSRIESGECSNDTLCK
jgi:hypothetical protein